MDKNIKMEVLFRKTAPSPATSTKYAYICGKEEAYTLYYIRR